MTATVVASLLIWSTWLAPGAGHEPSTSVDRCVGRLIVFQPLETIRPRDIQGENPWVISEADTDEEESEDGNSDLIRLPVSRDPLPLHHSANASILPPDRARFGLPVRSPILRC